MPASFDRCVRGGGRVRRVSGPSREHGLKEGDYVNFCSLKGKSHRGYVKKNHTENVLREAGSNPHRGKGDKRGY